MAFDSNTKGVLHELMTGYYLMGGHHLDYGEYSKLTYDLLPEQIDLVHRYGRVAAGSLLERLGGVHEVHWTSKAGDIERLTGIPTTQHNDPSDLVLTFRRASTQYVGVSLKVSDSTSQVPISNPGLESTLGGNNILDSHRENLYKLYPELRAARNKVERKALITPANSGKVKELNKAVLKSIVQNLHSQLVTMSSEETAEHIRKYVLHARSTPMQTQGHGHLRHTTYGKKNPRVKMIDPATEYEFLKEHWKLGFEYKGGNSLKFLYDGIEFAEQRMKFESQSDPLSTIKSCCKDIPKKTKYKQ